MKKTTLLTRKLNQFLAPYLPDGFAKYLSNTSWLMSERVGNILISSLVGILVARYLEPLNFGILNYALSLVALFGSLSTLGMDSILIREIVQDKKSTPKLMGSALLLRLIASVLSFVGLVVFLTLAHEPYLVFLITLILGGMMSVQSFQIINLYFKSQVRAKYAVIAQLSTTVISALLKLLFIYLKAPLVYFAVLLLADKVILSLGLIYAYQQVGQGVFSWRVDLKTARKLLTESWPLMFSAFMVSIYMRIDQILLKQLLDSEAVGIYAAAVKLSELWYFIPGAIVGSLYPALIKVKTQSEVKYQQRFQQLYSLIIWLALGLSIPTSLLAPYLVPLLYGPAYTQSASILQLHIWASVFVFLGVASTKWLLIENQQIYSTIFTTIGVIVNIILNLLLVPQIGVIGSAWATVIAYALSAYLLFALFPHTRKNFLWMTKSLNPVKMIDK